MAPRLRPPACLVASPIQAACFSHPFLSRNCRRDLSSSTAALGRVTTLRRNFFAWLEKYGSRFNGVPKEPGNYLGPERDQPFPLNPLFRSQPVLSEEARETIYQKYTKGVSMKALSLAGNIDVRRVSAILRMKKIEKLWTKAGKPLATPYAKAILSMVPTTQLAVGDVQTKHEPIGDIHAHSFTGRQVFVPTAESRRFTRQDAARAFHPYLLPADLRTPHPEVVEMERRLLKGMDREQAIQGFIQDSKNSETEVLRQRHREERRREQGIARVKTDRFEFRFEKVSVHDAGPKGRSRKSWGWRYGTPLHDRKRWHQKHPTQVPWSTVPHEARPEAKR